MSTTEPPNDDYKNLVDLLSVFSEAQNRMDQLQVSVNEGTLEVVDEHKTEYAKLQKTLAEAETALEIIARRHPDWFEKRKTIRSPYGEVALKENPAKLVAANEEVSILMLENEGKANPEFNASLYLRQKTELNLEALGDLTDDELKKFRIKRVQTDTFSVKPAKLDLGKAVKETVAPAK